VKNLHAGGGEGRGGRGFEELAAKKKKKLERSRKK